MRGVQRSVRVEEALADGQPVVALETTVITHGMAWPDNIEVVRAMEAAIEAEGAVPALAGIVAGRLTVGMAPADAERFARAPRDSVAKCSRRDLPVVLARGGDGSLTVAGTMLAAHAAGVSLFATGGIGGVHRHHPFDVSADLLELARTPVAVVCAGAKSILDLDLTLEVLETHGVPVIGYRTANLPAFFSRDSGLPLPAAADTLEGLARIYTTWREARAGNGLLITTPVPAEQALPEAEAERFIARAVAEADEKGIRGSAVTPYVLARLVALSDGRTLQANKALLVNNARCAAALAAKAASLRR